MDFKPFKIGKYLLLERIATGGMAEVYRAKASGAGGFEKQLAIKRILPSYSSNDEFRRMFEYEARLSSMLTHANIVQIYDFVKSGETYLLAMEYVDGKNLRQFVNKARKASFVAPIEFGIYVINEVCKGLDYAHKKKDDLTAKPLNIIHRDMSPQNIMMSYDGAVKIVDFGIAKAKDRVDETRSGVIKGKFGYMSPEQANGEPVDHRTDIFSTGIILYELLTGKRLFAADNDMATLKQIQECVIPPASRHNPKIGPDLERILLKALTKDVSLRYQNAGVFHRQLQEYLNKYYPIFTQREVSEILQRVFQEEIAHEKRRFEQIYRQSIPFSQSGESGAEEIGGILDDEVDGEVTRSENRAKTDVTFVADEESLKSAASAVPTFDPSVSRERTDPKAWTQDSSQATRLEPGPLEDEPISTMGKTGTPSTAAAASFSKQEPAPTEVEKKQGPGTGSKTIEQPTQVSQSQSRLFPPEDHDPTGSFKTESTAKTGNFEKEKLSVTPDSMTPSRRRDRSISASRDISSTAEDPIQLQEDSRPRRPARQEPFLMSDPIGYEPPRQSTYLRTFLIVVLVAVVGAVLYEHQLSRTSSPPLSSPVRPRDPSNDPARLSPQTGTSPEIKTFGDCALEISSDPPGARIVVDGSPRGTTSGTISGQCGKAFDLNLELDGYETYSENLVFKTRNGRVIRALKKIPMGNLEIQADRNAQVFIDKDLIGEVSAGQRFERPLRAGRRYRLRLVNEILNFEAKCDVLIQEGRVERVRATLVSGRCGPAPQ